MKSNSRFAGFWRRFLAFGVDSLILIPITLTLQYSLGIDPFEIFSLETTEDILNYNQQGLNLSDYLGAGLVALFSILMWVNFDGATPGKKLLAIKIVKTDGKKVSYPVAIIRYLSYIVSSFLLLLGYVWIFWDKKKQGFHDKIASTVVVKTNQKPKYFLAIVLTIFTIIIMTFFIGATAIQTSRILTQQKYLYDEVTNGFKTRQEYEEELTPEAKVYYDTTQELFSELQEVDGNRELVIPITDEIIENALLALEVEPENAFLWANLGDAYTWANSKGTAEDALDAYKKASELEPNNVLYKNMVGDMHIRVGEYEEAILVLKESIRLSDESGYTHLSLAIAYKELGINQEAETNYREALKLFEEYNQDGKYDDQILQIQKGLSEVSSN